MENGPKALRAVRYRTFTRFWLWQGGLWKQWHCEYSTGGVGEPKRHVVKLNGQFMVHVKQPRFPRHKWTKFRVGLGGTMVKNLPANAEDTRDVGSIPGSGRFSGGGIGNPFHCSCLENATDRGAWQATIHRVSKSWTQLSTVRYGLD